MSIGYGPKVVTDGLVLALDAADISSYPGSGTTWSDLSGNGYNAIQTGSRVSYNSTESAWEFTGTTTTTTDGIYITGLNYVTGSSDAISNLTIESWIKCNSGTTSHVNDQRIILSFDRSSVFRFAISNDIGAGAPGKPSFMDASGSSGVGDNVATSFSGDLRDDQWHQVCVTFSSTALKYYVDGKIVHTTTGSFNPITNQSTGETPRYGWIGNGSEAATAGGTINPGDLFYGFISKINYYYKTLSDSEIQQNFNSLRGRFGI